MDSKYILRAYLYLAYTRLNLIVLVKEVETNRKKIYVESVLKCFEKNQYKNPRHIL